MELLSYLHRQHSTIPLLPHAFLNVWQTLLLGWMCITWSITLPRLSFASCQGKTASTWTYWLLLRTLQFLLHRQQRTLAWDWTINCAAPPVSPQWPDRADLLSRTSAGSCRSSRGKWQSSCSKHSLSPTSIIATRSWVDCLPPWACTPFVQPTNVLPCDHSQSIVHSPQLIYDFHFEIPHRNVLMSCVTFWGSLLPIEHDICLWKQGVSF